ncbi:DUF2232 domain-containing protein [Paenibacillus roseus]|uniref:DUF2232 domain-containing protein n=1 Tax=Paenibacillus roseus TaxID=2798579 RepID=A0A934J2N1_9BACL|nr:DUF2232 domain-containing protein [Paenibacillus roseus]MBJ6361665.1 DUF2232 domain-containing protein [Paenibacillus roseus]
MNTGLKSVLWSAAAILLLLMMTIPLINILASVLIMVPFIVLYTTSPRRLFVLYVVIILGLGYALTGLAALIFGLFFLVPAIVAGHMYQRKAQARTVLTVITIVLLGQMLLELLLFSAVLEVSLVSELGNLFRNSVSELSQQGLMPPVWDDSMTDMLIRLMTQSIPLIFIVMSFILAVVAQWVSRRVLNNGYGLDIQGMPPAKDWMMPKSLVAYYLVALILELFMTGDHNSYISVVLINMIPLLRLVFAIQTVGFFFFLADQKRWHKAVPLLLAVPVFLFPPLSLIGVLDVAFPIRKSFKRT